MAQLVFKSDAPLTRPNTLGHDNALCAGVSRVSVAAPNTPGHARTRCSCGQEKDKRRARLRAALGPLVLSCTPDEYVELILETIAGTFPQ